MMNKDQFTEVISKLDLMCRLLAVSVATNVKSLKGRIELLSAAGLRPMDIASLLNTTQNYVNVILSKFREGKEKRSDDQCL